MKRASVTLHRTFVHEKPIDKRLYSAFMEHIGSIIYGQTYDPKHETANEHGFRRDVIELVRKLQLPMIRYPGGNFTASYNWEDTVGPIESRPTRLELAWQCLEPNRVGLAEFSTWLEAVDAELMMAVNMGTRDIQEAIDVVEYCNFPGGTYYSDLRKAHGHASPYDIKLWCVGNETDGPWQIARRRPEEYGWLAAEAAKAIKRIDPDLELVVAGSSTPTLSTYGEWDRKVLEDCYELYDYIALHHYLGRNDGDLGEYLASSREMEKQIETITAVCDYIKGIKKSDKTMYLSFDEYNVLTGVAGEETNEVPRRSKDTLWKIGGDLGMNRSVYTMKETLLFGSALLSLMRYSDRVKIACQSILVGGGGLVRAEIGGPAWVNPMYYPMLHVSTYGRGTLMHQVYQGAQYDTEKYGIVNSIDSISMLHDGEVDIFAINRTAEALSLDTVLQGFTSLEAIEHILLHGDRIDVANTLQSPMALAPITLQDIGVQKDNVQCTLPPYSWNVLRIKTED